MCDYWRPCVILGYLIVYNCVCLPVIETKNFNSIINHFCMFEVLRENTWNAMRGTVSNFTHRKHLIFILERNSWPSHLLRHAGGVLYLCSLHLSGLVPVLGSGFKAQEGPCQMKRLFSKHPENTQVCESCAWQLLPHSLANGKQI